MRSRESIEMNGLNYSLSILGAETSVPGRMHAHS